MSEMVERVARVIYELLEGPVANQDASRQMRQWELARELARAAIAGMREPTDGQLNAARDWSCQSYGKPIGNHAATGCWEFMIDAALR